MKHGSEIQSGYCTFLLPETRGGLPAPMSGDTQLSALQFQDFWHPLPASEGPEHVRSTQRQGSFLSGDTCVCKGGCVCVCVCKGGYVCVQRLCDGTRVQEKLLYTLLSIFLMVGRASFEESFSIQVSKSKLPPYSYRPNVIPASTQVF